MESLKQQSARQWRGGVWAAIILAPILAIAWLKLAAPVLPAVQLTRTITDLAGREVLIPKEVKRLIALGPGALRLVVYLGATDKIVGIEDMEYRMARSLYERPYAQSLKEAFFALPVVGAGGPGVLPDFEKVLMCRPDLIVAVSMAPGQLDNIQAKTGVPAIYLSYGELGVWRDQARRSLALLGEAIGQSARAAAINAYVAFLEQDLARRVQGIAENAKPRVYFGGVSYKGSQGLASTEADYSSGRLVGARNLADGLGLRGHFLVDKEQILLWDPDYIFVDIASRVILDQEFERNREYYQLLSASQATRIYSLLPYNYYNTNIELALLNAYFIGKTLYPERFGDIQMEEQSAKILGTFLGVQFDRQMPEIPAYRPLRFSEGSAPLWR